MNHRCEYRVKQLENQHIFSFLRFVLLILKQKYFNMRFVHKHFLAMTAQIQSDLILMRDEKFAKFNANLLPTVAKDAILGIRTPALRNYAKKISFSDKFLDELPHRYFEENQIHAFILSEIRDFDICVSMVDKFLPYIDNWATCDQLSPKTFAKNTDKLLSWLNRWIKSKHTYTVRFAICMLMQHYLGDRFNLKYAKKVINIKTDEYYINMMRAWYFATAVAKQYNRILPYFEKGRLDEWTRAHAIQKALESFRVSDEHKKELRLLK